MESKFRVGIISVIDLQRDSEKDIEWWKNLGAKSIDELIRKVEEIEGVKKILSDEVYEKLVFHVLVEEGFDPSVAISDITGVGGCSLSSST